MEKLEYKEIFSQILFFLVLSVSSISSKHNLFLLFSEYLGGEVLQEILFFLVFSECNLFLVFTEYLEKEILSEILIFLLFSL